MSSETLVLTKGNKNNCCSFRF